MLESTERKINELLSYDEDYKELEKEVAELLPAKLAADGIEDENINLLVELEKIIMSKAYLKGYADGLEDQVKNNVKENPSNYLSISSVDKLLTEMGV